MRTSTVVFLVLFLCLYSSREHRSELRAVVSQVADTVSDMTRHATRHGCDRDAEPTPVAADDAETRALRDQLRDVKRRDLAAAKTLRSVERSIRSLEDRIRDLEAEARKDPRYGATYESGLALLIRQKTELQAEHVEIEALQETLKSTAIRMQAEIDLAHIRAQRKEVEAFLDRERGSPVDRLARDESWSSR